MSKHIWKSRLGMKLTSAAAAALAAAVLFMLIFYTISILGLNYYLNNSSYMDQRLSRAADRFQEYVTDHDLSIEDRDEITQWINKRALIIISLYQGHYLIYDSMNPDLDTYDIAMDISAVNPLNRYNISFKDADVVMTIDGFLDYPYYTCIFVIGIILAFILFFAITMLVISRRIAYISQLDEEIQIFGGGDLSVPVTVKKGRDELTSLAFNLEEMRKAMTEKLSVEEDIRKQKEELVTSISHDLRTPLTALIGYLEIIKSKKYKSEDQKEEYLDKILDKAFQMKQLSNYLFESFMREGPATDTACVGPAPAVSTLMELVGDSAMYLGEQGFQVIKTGSSGQCMVCISMEYAARIFDNLISNIMKYADPRKPVYINVYRENDSLVIQYCNQVRLVHDVTGSSGIGLGNIRKLMEAMQGSYTTENSKTEWKSCLYFRVFVSDYMAGDSEGMK